MSDYILGFSDQHLRDTGSFIPFNQTASNGLSKELNNMIAGWQFVAEMVRKYKPKLVHNFGDVVHITENQSAQVIHGMYLAHEVVYRACKDVGALFTGHTGNHDVLNEQLGINNVNVLSRYYDKFFIDSQIYEPFQGLRIGVLPYTSNEGKLVYDLGNYQFKVDVMFGHMDIRGCRYESGQISEADIDYYSPDLPLISGDIHLPQSFRSVHYVGSLVQHRFNLDNLDHVGGILLMDIHTKEITRVSNSFSKHYIKVRDESLERVLQLDPNRCVFQVVSSRSKEEIDQLFAGREYHYTPEVRPVSQVKNYYMEFSIQDPQEVLRNWITKDRPDALAEFDHIFGEMK